MFELGEYLLDRIEIGRVRRKEQKPCANGADHLPDGTAFMAAEIVEDDNVAWLESGYQNLLDIGFEAQTIDRAVENARRINAVAAERCQEGHGFPMTMRDLGFEPLPPQGPAPQRRHVGLGPSLVDEDQASWIDPRLILLPTGPMTCDIRPVLFAG